MLLVAAALIWAGAIDGAGETAKSSLTGTAQAAGGAPLDAREAFTPGFQYTLQQEQIDEVIAFLRTYSPPARTAAAPEN